ncbi:MAG: hypothetical protein U0Q12_21780 [Vicinamibacterales bacterium]
MRRAPHLARVALGLSLAGLVGTGCAKRAPKAAPEPVALEVPKVPDRVLPPVTTAIAETEPEPTPAPEPTPSRRTAVRQQRPRTDTPKPADAVPTPPVEAAPPPANPSGPLLRKPQTADTDEAVRRIRGMLERATRDLGRVNYGTLKGEIRAQYESVKRFIEQAEEALRSKNLDIASFLADKAQTLAHELFGQ